MSTFDIKSTICSAILNTMNTQDSDRQNLGTRLRQARKAAGLSLRQTAQRIGVSPATLSAIENGKTGASVPRLRLLAAAFGTTVPWLIGEQPVTYQDQGAPHHTDNDPVRHARREWREFPPLQLDPVLAAAIDSFVETGYHGATMRSIADRAGMSVPGVYHHYREKQDLLVRALELTMEELHWRVRAARSEGTNAVERLAHTVEALALFHTRRRALAFIGASEMRSLTPHNRQRIAASRNSLQYLLDQDIAAAITDEGADHDGAHIAGRAIATMCTSLPQWFQLDGPTSPEQIAAQYSDFALGLLGLRHRERPIAGTWRQEHNQARTNP